MTHSAHANWEPLPFTRPYMAPNPHPAETDAARVRTDHKTHEDHFALEQLNRLVQRLYVPGHRGGHRHVAFSSLEPSGVRPWIGAWIGRLLAQQVSESVCVVEADQSAKLFQVLVNESIADTAQFGGVTGNDLTHRIDRNLWLCPASRLLREDTWTPRGDAVRHRMSRLRRDFGYLVIHAPALGVGEEATLMGQLSEGLVLVVEAGRTRRVAADRARRSLEDLGVPLLGTILDQRNFPIPEAIYRRI